MLHSAHRISGGSLGVAWTGRRSLGVRSKARPKFFDMTPDLRQRGPLASLPFRPSSTSRESPIRSVSVSTYTIDRFRRTFSLITSSPADRFLSATCSRVRVIFPETGSARATFSLEQWTRISHQQLWVPDAAVVRQRRLRTHVCIRRGEPVTARQRALGHFAVFTLVPSVPDVVRAAERASPPSRTVRPVPQQ